MFDKLLRGHAWGSPGWRSAATLPPKLPGGSSFQRFQWEMPSLYGLGCSSKRVKGNSSGHPYLGVPL
ncbi:UNVERIFIED_CONTAM: hypothetical protein Slati_1095900 [Sesamum latifolium]|uniref:Uncharacterized protein n=1 Tax=Sesamum latifolium TaxID=2727402 RepID=A0AAW2XU29_9LAMI